MLFSYNDYEDASNMVKTSKTGPLLSTPCLLNRPLRGEGMRTGFS